MRWKTMDLRNNYLIVIKWIKKDISKELLNRKKK